jgi:hypothetical protein
VQPPNGPPPAQAQPPKASPEPAPQAPSKANLFEAVGTDLADVPGGHDDEEIELA